MVDGIRRHQYHSLSSEGGRWQFSSYILWLTEKITQTNKNDRYVLQNSRGRNLAVKRARVILKVALAN